MRILSTLMFGLWASSAVAHPGHWADVAGHDHWVAGAAIGLAGLAAIWGALKGKKAEKDQEPATEDQPDEAPA